MSARTRTCGIYQTTDGTHTAFDPFEAADSIPYDEFAEIRRRCPVARTPTGWYLSRRDDVLEATKSVDTFVSSFREPGVVVPDEEKLIEVAI